MPLSNYFTQARDTKINTLNLTSNDWKIGGVPISASAEDLNNGVIVNSGTIALTMSGAFSSPENVSFIYTKAGKIVTAVLNIPSAVTTDTDSFITTSVLPSFLRSNFQEAITYINNITSGNHVSPIRLIIRADGEIQIFSDLAGSHFANPTEFYFRPISFSYIANS